MRKYLKQLSSWRLVLTIIILLHYHFSLLQVTPNANGYIFFSVALVYAGILCLTRFKRQISSNLKWIIVFLDLLVISFAVHLLGGGFLFYLYYLPIIAIAERDGTRDALITSFMAGIIFILFHLSHFGFTALMESMSFLVVGLFTGVLLEKHSYTFRADLPLDVLTNLPTRRTFNHRVDTVIMRENIKQYAVIILDVDDFRIFNEHNGFNQGNLVLKMIAQVIMEQIRSDDIAARYDGEEYVVFLPNADKEVAVQIAERLRDTIQVIQIVEGFSGIKISVGVAEAPEDGDDIYNLLGLARHRMYRAKDLGGDRVIASLTE